MSEAPRRWIRLDVGWDESDWLAELSPEARLGWVALLCTVKRDGIGGSVKAPTTKGAARNWGVSEFAVAELLAAASYGEEPALVIANGAWTVTAWDDYQKPDQTAAERKRKQREREEEMSRPVTRDIPPTGCDPSVSVSPTLEVVVGVGSGEGDAAAWMHAIWQEELGVPGRVINLNRDRQQKYRAMYDEQLKGTPEPQVAWRAVLWAVKQSDHHMSQRAYQMPESILKSESRRERWVLTALDLMQKGSTSKQEQNVIKIREYLRRSEA